MVIPHNTQHQGTVPQSTIIQVRKTNFYSQVLQVLIGRTNEAKSVAGNHWLRLLPSVALLRGQVWSSLGISCQQQQLVD